MAVVLRSAPAPETMSSTSTDDSQDSQFSIELNRGDEPSVDLRKPAKRARYDKTGQVPFIMTERLCFAGGYLKEPVALTTKCVDEVQFFKVRGRDTWLSQAATGKVSRRGHFEKGVYRVKEQLLLAITQAAKDADAKHIVEALRPSL